MVLLKISLPSAIIHLELAFKYKNLTNILEEFGLIVFQTMGFINRNHNPFHRSECCRVYCAHFVWRKQNVKLHLTTGLKSLTTF